MRMKRSTIVWVTALAFAAVGQANAADMYRAPEGGGGYKDSPLPYVNWSGFYIGANGGYGWSASDQHIGEYTGSALGYSTSGNAQASGGFGGGQLGYNFSGARLGLGSSIVLGFEADIQGSGVEGESTVTPSAGGGTLKVKQSLDYFGTVRGRLGYAVGPSLLYATGGLAYGNVHNSLSSPSLATPLIYDGKGVQTGYAVGGGFEYKFNPAWSAKAEYQYIDLGGETVPGVNATANCCHLADAEASFHIVRAGINYHVGNTYEPLK